MPKDSEYLTILERIQTDIRGLGLTFGGNQVQAPIKKIPRWTANVQSPPLPIIFIVGEDKPESVVPWSTEDEVLVQYFISVVTVAQGTQDNTANLDVWLNWRQQERRLFQWGLQATIPSAFFSEFVPDPPILKTAFLKNYDTSGFGFRFWNIEPRQDSTT